MCNSFVISLEPVKLWQKLVTQVSCTSWGTSKWSLCFKKIILKNRIRNKQRKSVFILCLMGDAWKHSNTGMFSILTKNFSLDNKTCISFYQDRCLVIESGFICLQRGVCNCGIVFSEIQLRRQQATSSSALSTGKITGNYLASLIGIHL